MDGCKVFEDWAREDIIDEDEVRKSVRGSAVVLEERDEGEFLEWSRNSVEERRRPIENIFKSKRA